MFEFMSMEGAQTLIIIFWFLFAATIIAGAVTLKLMK